MFYGLRSQQFKPEEVVAAGQEISRDPAAKPGDHLMVASILKHVAPPDTYIPVLQTALKATAGETDPEAVQERKELEIDAALLIDHDRDKALALKRASMPAGWQEDPSQVNSFAWWCCENDVNLEEAFDLAMQSAKLATSDGDRANILDTAAEIAFKRGDAKKAIELEEQAIKLAPDRKGFTETLERFRTAKPQ